MPGAYNKMYWRGMKLPDALNSWIHTLKWYDSLYARSTSIEIQLLDVHEHVYTVGHHSCDDNEFELRDGAWILKSLHKEFELTIHADDTEMNICVSDEDYAYKTVNGLWESMCRNVEYNGLLEDLATDWDNVFFFGTNS